MNMIDRIALFCFLSTIVFFTACSGTKNVAQTSNSATDVVVADGKSVDEVVASQTQWQIDQPKMLAYMEAKGWEDPAWTNSGVYYIMEKEGKGKTPEMSSSITVKYKGSFIDGETFWDTKEEEETFTLQQTVLGWRHALSNMKEGGKMKMIIPSELAYGKQGWNDVIPANAILVYEVELVKVQ